MRCGREENDPKRYFYMAKTSPLFTANDLYTHICSDCVGKLFFEMKAKYKDAKIALMIICHYLDIYFSERLYEQLKDNANFTIGIYLQKMGLVQYRGKSFNNSLMELIEHGLTDEEIIRDEIEEKWEKSDLKNKAYVIQSIGYDCFNDESYSSNNRKFLFNTLADYLTDDVLEDPHKLQCVIAMVKTTLQVDSIDRMINQELKRGITDSILIDKLSSVKDKLSRNINNAANENGISAKTSGKNSRGTNTLTHIMKEMTDNGFEEIKVNVVSAKMSNSYQEIAQANAKALLDELSLTSDEYAQMVAKQSSMISDLQSQIETVEEENRLLKIENKHLKQEVGE